MHIKNRETLFNHCCLRTEDVLDDRNTVTQNKGDQLNYFCLCKYFTDPLVVALKLHFAHYSFTQVYHYQLL